MCSINNKMPYRPPLKLFVPQDARDNDQPPPHSLCYCEQCQERRQLDRLKGEREPLIPLPKSVQAQLTDQEYHKILDGKVSESPPPISEPPASTTMSAQPRAQSQTRQESESGVIWYRWLFPDKYACCGWEFEKDFEMEPSS